VHRQHVIAKWAGSIPDDPGEFDLVLPSSDRRHVSHVASNGHGQLRDVEHLRGRWTELLVMRDETDNESSLLEPSRLAR
jgi:hypothetical protein